MCVCVCVLHEIDRVKTHVLSSLSLYFRLYLLSEKLPYISTREVYTRRRIPQGFSSGNCVFRVVSGREERGERERERGGKNYSEMSCPDRFEFFYELHSPSYGRSGKGRSGLIS